MLRSQQSILEDAMRDETPSFLRKRALSTNAYGYPDEFFCDRHTLLFDKEEFNPINLSIPFVYELVIQSSSIPDAPEGAATDRFLEGPKLPLFEFSLLKMVAYDLLLYTCRDFYTEYGRLANDEGRYYIYGVTSNRPDEKDPDVEECQSPDATIEGTECVRIKGEMGVTYYSNVAEDVDVEAEIKDNFFRFLFDNMEVTADLDGTEIYPILKPIFMADGTFRAAPAAIETAPVILTTPQSSDEGSVTYMATAIAGAAFVVLVAVMAAFRRRRRAKDLEFEMHGYGSSSGSEEDEFSFGGQTHPRDGVFIRTDDSISQKSSRSGSSMLVSPSRLSGRRVVADMEQASSPDQKTNFQQKTHAISPILARSPQRSNDEWHPRPESPPEIYSDQEDEGSTQGIDVSFSNDSSDDGANIFGGLVYMASDSDGQLDEESQRILMDLQGIPTDDGNNYFSRSTLKPNRKKRKKSFRAAASPRAADVQLTLAAIEEEQTQGSVEDATENGSKSIGIGSKAISPIRVTPSFSPKSLKSTSPARDDQSLTPRSQPMEGRNYNYNPFKDPSQVAYPQNHRQRLSSTPKDKHSLGSEIRSPVIAEILPTRRRRPQYSSPPVQKSSAAPEVAHPEIVIKERPGSTFIATSGTQDNHVLYESNTPGSPRAGMFSSPDNCRSKEGGYFNEILTPAKEPSDSGSSDEDNSLYMPERPSFEYPQPKRPGQQEEPMSPLTESGQSSNGSFRMGAFNPIGHIVDQSSSSSDDDEDLLSQDQKKALDAIYPMPSEKERSMSSDQSPVQFLFQEASPPDAKVSLRMSQRKSRRNVSNHA